MFGVKSLQNPSLPASRRLSYAFYVCCLNLNGDTSSKGEQICLELEEAEWKCYCGGLGGVGLRLALARGRGDETPLSIRTAFTLLAKSSECFEFNLGRAGVSARSTARIMNLTSRLRVISSEGFQSNANTNTKSP